MANGSSFVESFDEYDVVILDDLSSWEFIEASSSDDGEDLDNFSLSEENIPNDDVLESKEECPHELGSPSLDISVQSLVTELQPPNLDDVYEDHDDVSAGALRDDGYSKYDDEDNDDYDDDDDDDDDGYDLDDELVPWEVSDKFGRQRIRKLGKRACPRMNRSKRLPYYYTRPGCVHGKHGFGVQHVYI